MTTWQPSEGLKRADAVVAEIEQAMEACGVAPPDGMPMRAVLGHRLTEIVAAAIDAAVTAYTPITQGGTSKEVKYTNGHYRTYPGVGTETEASEQVQALSKSTMPLQSPSDSFRNASPAAIQAALTPVKKRGRPKGSTKKAKKPAKGDKANEASPAAE